MRGSLFLVILCAGAGAFAACSGAGGDEKLGDGQGDVDGGTLDGGDDGGGFDPTETGGDKKVMKIEVTPASSTIDVVNGDTSKASVALKAIATMSDMSTAEIASCVWTVDRIDLGAMMSSSFVASGGAGGVATVSCATLGMTAKATITVNLKDSLDDGSGLDDTSKTDLLAATTADPAVTRLLYPYDLTVFPKGLEAPELMWNGGAASDVYAAVLETPGMTLTKYFKAPPPGRMTIPKAEWTKLLDSNVAGGTVQLTLYRLAGGAGGTAFKSTTQHWTIANGSLKGTIYYWRINGGRVVRIKPGASAPDDFLKGSSGHSCIACHSVSRDGSTIAAAYDGGWSPWATFDTTTGNEIKYSGTASGFEAITPDGSLVVNGQSGGMSGAPLGLNDAKTGASYEPSGVADFGLAVMPTFSNDGKTLAFSVRKDGNWLDFNQSDLSIATFDPTSKKFGLAKVIRPSGGRAMIYPSFTPDDQWIAYEDGPMARTRGNHAKLHLVNLDGSIDLPLEKLTNGGVVDADKDLVHEPTFNPVLTGGYYWLVYVSERQYGNRLTKTLLADATTCGSPSWDATPCRNKQLWVAAIDASPKAGTDPSHPGFWLPGQGLADQNMRGYWTLDVCKKLGDTCEAGFECCDGTCKSPDGMSAKVCIKPPPGTCAATGDKCTTTADCCDKAVGVECVGGVCGKKAPS
ncbi:MAG: hypothetical protein ACXWUG_05680 [Polyangiales bacterium]